MNLLHSINSAHDSLHDRNLFITYTDRYPRLSITATIRCQASLP